MSGEGAHDRKRNCNFVKNSTFQHHPAGGSVRLPHREIPHHGVRVGRRPVRRHRARHQVHGECRQGHDQGPCQRSAGNLEPIFPSRPFHQI